MRPVMYGYLRLVNGVSGVEDTEAARRALAEFAEREGFALAQVFTERLWRSESAFSPLLEAIKRYDVKNVIVQSLWHFSRLPGLQNAMRQHIEQETGARLWIIQGGGDG